MAIITFSRQIGAHGDEIAQLVAEKLKYKFFKRTDIEQKIVELGFPVNKMPKYDERKPGFFASLAKDRDTYLNYAQYAILEAAELDNSVIIGRGAFVVLKNAVNHISIRLVANDKTRLERLMKEHNLSEKEARQRIVESDMNRDGFHKNFYNVDVEKSDNYDMVLNSSLMSDDICAETIATYLKARITKQNETEGKKYIANLLKAQSVVNKILFDSKLNIEFLHADIEDKSVILYGVSDSNIIVENALDVVRKEMPDFKAESRISIVHEFKTFQ